MPSNGDNHAYDMDPLHPVTKRPESQILLGYGHAALRSSLDFAASQINFDAYHLGTYQHSPRAVNAIQLTAFGRSMLDHPHYVRNRLRNLNGATYSWNTVTVNGLNQIPSSIDGLSQHRGDLTVKLSPITDPSGSGGDWVVKGGDITGFWDTGGVSAIESDGYRAYYPLTQPGGFSRMVVHNTMDTDNPYTIDVFRVEGGEKHEYVLHSDTQTDFGVFFGEGVESITQIPEEEPVPDPTCPYGFSADDSQWRDVFTSRKEGVVRGGRPYEIEFRADCREDSGNILRCEDGRKPVLRVWGVNGDGYGDQNTTLLSGQVPHNYREYEDSRRSGWSGCDMDVLDPITRYDQGFVAVKKVKQSEVTVALLRSLFIHVLEPKRDAAAPEAANGIKSVERVPLRDGDGENDDVVALTITKNDGRKDDVIIRLTPGTGGFEATLPLAHPVMPEIRTLGGEQVLPEGGHVLLKSEAMNASSTILIGGNSEGNVIEGFFSEVGQDNHDEYPWYFIATTPIVTTDNNRLSGQHVLVALGSYAPSTVSKRRGVY